MKEELVTRYRNLVSAVVSVDYRAREGIEQYKAKFLLADGSSLRISEVFVDDELVKYSYYWLDESNNLIAGWDNAAHHPEVRSHPHHLHIPDQMVDSTIQNLEGVLDLLSKKIK